MGERTGIAWTDASWNWIQGCHKVSAGCKFCYMFRDKERYGQNPNVVVRSKPHTFNMPLRLKGPARVFTCSWSDFFIEEADEWRTDAWDIIARTPHLTYQILTKRPERIMDHLPYKWALGQEPPWAHVWIGVSVEDQETADERLPILLQIPAMIRWASYEPALGPVSFFGPDSPTWNRDHGLDWIVVGGESGPKARPFEVAWARRTLTTCHAAGLAVFVKQLGRWPVIEAATGNGPDVLRRQHAIDSEWPEGTHFGNPTGIKALNGRVAILRDRAGADPSEWPADLQVQEFPA